MEILKGMILTPDKKGYLVDELNREIGLVDTFIRKRILAGKSLQGLKEIRQRLVDSLGNLQDKKGVVTPSEVDETLQLIDDAKRSRLESEYTFGLKKSTFYLLGLIALGVGIYIYTQKRGQ
jgi:hypothetical protein